MDWELFERWLGVFSAVVVPLAAYRGFVILQERVKRNTEEIVILKVNDASLDKRLDIVERDNLITGNNIAGLQESFDKVIDKLDKIEFEAGQLRKDIHASDKSTSNDLSRIKERLRIEDA